MVNGTTDELVRRADLDGNAVLFDARDQLTPADDVELLAQNVVRVPGGCPDTSPAALTLIRPDGHVAWAQDDDIATADITAAIAHMRHRQPQA